MSIFLDELKLLTHSYAAIVIWRNSPTRGLWFGDLLSRMLLSLDRSFTCVFSFWRIGDKGGLAEKTTFCLVYPWEDSLKAGVSTLRLSDRDDLLCEWEDRLKRGDRPEEVIRAWWLYSIRQRRCCVDNFGYCLWRLWLLCTMMISTADLYLSGLGRRMVLLEEVV